MTRGESKFTFTNIKRFFKSCRPLITSYSVTKKLRFNEVFLIINYLIKESSIKLLLHNFTFVNKDEAEFHTESLQRCPKNLPCFDLLKCL